MNYHSRVSKYLKGHLILFVISKLLPKNESYSNLAKPFP